MMCNVSAVSLFVQIMWKISGLYMSLNGSGGYKMQMLLNLNRRCTIRVRDKL